MYIFKYALKSIIRSIGRNILIGVVVLLVTAASVIALTIRHSAEDIVSLQEERFELVASINLDRNLLRTNYGSSNENMRALMTKVPTLKLEDILNYSNSQYVEKIEYNLSVELNGDGIKPVGEEEELEPVTTKGVQGGENAIKSEFTLVGYTHPEKINAFIEGEYQMIQGSVYDLMDKPSNALISDELALFNQLEIGDSLWMTNPRKPEESIELTIAGVYVDKSIDNQNNSWFSNSANQLISNYGLVSSLYEVSLSNAETVLNVQLNHLFHLSEGTAIDFFKDELVYKGLNEYYVLRSNLGEFEKNMQPLNNLINFTSFFLWLVLAVGGLILLTINMINIRERKYEIGVMRAMGMKKIAVSTQFLTELCIVTLIAMTLGIGAGNLLSETTANYMLNNEVNQIIAEQDAIQTNLGGNNGSGSRNNIISTSQEFDDITEIKTPMEYTVMFKIMAIGLIIVLMGSLISLVFISRYEPLKILSSRT